MIHIVLLYYIQYLKTRRFQLEHELRDPSESQCVNPDEIRRLKTICRPLLWYYVAGRRREM